LPPNMGPGEGRNGHSSSGGSHYATPEGHEQYTERERLGYRVHGHQAHTLGNTRWFYDL
jgi:hypothetical protein